MKTIKVIDLLVKRANGERPKKFKLHMYQEDFIYELSDNGGYYEINTEEEFTESINLIFCLNNEVEIIEDIPKEDKKMEKIDISKFPKRNNSLKKTALKVNEIIELLNNSFLLSEKDVSNFLDNVNGDK